MTKKILLKLNDKQLHYCKTISSLINKDRKEGAHLQYEKDTGKLRGFLECLNQMNVITQNEMKTLYLWFFSKDRIENDDLINNYYFTFGNDILFPYQNGYLIVKAYTLDEAIQKFRNKFPDRRKNIVNCAFWYTEDNWNKTIMCRSNETLHEIIY